jgi:type II secretory pathway pseudopilin PulG
VKTTRAGNESRGFTLAGVLVLVSIVMIFVAYTVPKQWSAIMQREREKQTIYAMRQYARACYEFQKKHNVWPSSIDQVREARLPRFIRGGPKGELIDPLTGQVDWLVIPATAANQPGQNNQQPGTVVGPGGNFGVGRGDPGSSGSNGTTSGGTTTGSGSGGSTGKDGTGKDGAGQQTLPGIPIKDYAGGPFIGVRPAKMGASMIELRGAKSYDQWSFTAQDLDQEIQAYRLGIQNSTQFK